MNSGIIRGPISVRLSEQTVDKIKRYGITNFISYSVMKTIDEIESAEEEILFKTKEYKYNSTVWDYTEEVGTETFYNIEAYKWMGDLSFLDPTPQIISYLSRLSKRELEHYHKDEIKMCLGSNPFVLSSIYNSPPNQILAPIKEVLILKEKPKFNVKTDVKVRTYIVDGKMETSIERTFIINCNKMEVLLYKPSLNELPKLFV